MRKKQLGFLGLACLSGLLSLAAYAFSGFGWLMWVAWIPLLFGLYRFPEKWSGGFLGLLISLEISVGVYLVLLSIQSWMIYFAIVFPILLALIFSAVWWFSRKASLGIRLLIIASCVALLDFLIALTPITAVISPAITQGGAPFLLSPASLFGFPFVTFLIFLFNGLAALLAADFKNGNAVHWRPVVIGVLVIAISFLVPILVPVYESEEINIGVLDAGMIDGGVHQVSGYLAEEREKLGHLEGLYAELTQKAAQEGADIIVWSEKFLPADPLSDPALKAQVENFVDQLGSVLIVTYESDQKQNIAVPVSPGEGFGTIYQKTNVAGIIGEEVIAGSQRPIYQVEGVDFGLLICFDMHFEENSRALTHDGAGLIIVTSNAGSVTNSVGWVARTASIRAVENGVPYVVASDIGAYFVTPEGQISLKTDGTTPMILTGSIRMTPGKTIYNRYGGQYVRWLLLPGFLGAFSLALFKQRISKRSKTSELEPEVTPGAPM